MTHYHYFSFIGYRRLYTQTFITASYLIGHCGLDLSENYEGSDQTGTVYKHVLIFL